MAYELTEQEELDLATGYQRGMSIQLAAEAKELTSKIQRDLIATARQCQALLAANLNPAVAAYYARLQTYLAIDLARFEPNWPAVKASVAAVMGFTDAEMEAIKKALGLAVQSLLNTAEDGSTIAADAANILVQFFPPVSFY